MAPAPTRAATRYERRLDAAGGGRQPARRGLRPRRARRPGPRSRPPTRARRRSATWRPASRRRCCVAYVLWLLEAAAARGIVRVHFLARDGQVLHAIARRLAPRLPSRGSTCRYLAASRQIWTRAISASPDHHWLWYGDRPGTTLADLLRRLARARRRPSPPSSRALGFPEAAWSRPLAAAEIVRLRRLARRAPAFAAAAAPARAANRRRLVAHLAQEGVLDPGPGGDRRPRLERARCTIRCRGSSPRRGPRPSTATSSPSSG